MLRIARRLRDTGVRYLVIDAGWYKGDGTDWSNGHGDWIPNARLFPGGLEATAAAIRECGLIPGLWFEIETVGSQSAAYREARHLLMRDGMPLTVRERRFWDLNDPAAFAYLTERVIDRLERCGFGYLKVDYNETVGLGCDHPDSLGEGLRVQTLGTYRFFEAIRDRLPNLVIENCASGGHRLEPSMLAHSAMSSFSDAHELREIPIIAANLHRLMLPRQSQIWAVLHEQDSLRQIAYSLAATFLGRMCLSGEVIALDESQWGLVRQAIALYRVAAPIVKDGISRRFGETGESWRHPRGWQAVVRTNRCGNDTLVVIHTFADAPGELCIPLPGGGWKIREQFPMRDVAVEENALSWERPSDFNARVLLLSRDCPPSP